MSRSAPEAGARVLIVEDDPAVRRVHAGLLEGAGHLVETAEDGQTGLEKVLSFRPDVVLTDWVMPRMDGLTLCRLVKGNEELRATYVIMLSTRDEASSKVAGLDVGADDYLVKPADGNELKARVRAGLRLRRALTELAAKNELLERLALTDPLTGLANRRAFDESLAVEASRTFRSCKPLALLYLDLDRFKEVNDAHGHEAGDDVLIAFADLLKRKGRRGDLVARIGGEEFAILLPHTDQAQAVVVAERIRRGLGEGPIGHRPPVTITVSIGVSVFEGKSVEQAAALLKKADEALYRSKSGGRNRVTAFDERKARS